MANPFKILLSSLFKRYAHWHICLARDKKSAPILVLSLFILVVAVCLYSSNAKASTKDISHLNGIAAARQMVSEVKGINELDTSARRYAALEIIRKVVLYLSDGRDVRNKLTREETALIKDYVAVRNKVTFQGDEPRSCMKQIEQTNLGSALLWPGEKEFPPSIGCVHLFSRLNSYYEYNDNFRNEIYTRYLAKEMFEKYSRLKATEQLNAKQPNNAKQTSLAKEIKNDRVITNKFLSTFGVSATSWYLFMFGTPLVLLGLGVAREKRSFEPDESDPFTINSGWSSYKLHSYTGTVLNPTKSRTVTTHVSGGGSYAIGEQVHHNPVSSYTSETIHDQFFLRGNDGAEKDFKLVNVDLALRDGHKMSVLWGIKKGKDTGYHFLYHNHTLQKNIFIDGVISGMMNPHRWPVFPLMFLATLIWGYWGVWAMDVIFHSQAHKFFEAFGWLLAPGIAASAFFILRKFVGRRRVRNLKQHLAEKTLPILARRAA